MGVRELGYPGGLINRMVHLSFTLTLVGVALGGSVCLRAGIGDWGSVRHGAQGCCCGGVCGSGPVGGRLESKLGWGLKRLCHSGGWGFYSGGRCGSGPWVTDLKRERSGVCLTWGGEIDLDVSVWDLDFLGLGK